MSPPCYLITVDELKSPVLQHVYTVAPRKPPLQERVDQLTAIELHRITPKDKLMQLGRIADSLNTANPDVPWSLFQKVDDQIPIWLALYEESTQKAAARRCRIYGNRAPSFSDHSRISHSPSMDSLSGESIASSGY